MSKIEKYAQWLVDNQDKAGTDQYNKVVEAYKLLRSQQDTAISVSKEPSEQQATAQETEATKQPMTAGEVAKSAALNFPSSFAGVVGDIYQAITNPVDTASNLLKIASGTLQHALPEEFVELIGNDASKESREMASAMAEYYADRYGSVEGFKEALATDPAAVMMDAASVVSGGAGLATKVGVPAKITQKGQQISSYIDPISLAGKGAEKLVSGASAVVTPMLGKTTGAGAEAIEAAYVSGKKGGESGVAFRQSLRGEISMADVLDTAKADLMVMKQAKNEQYKKALEALQTDSKILGFGGIDKALNSAFNIVTGKGKVINEKGAKALQDAKQIIDEWKQGNPAELHTPEGFDLLKQKIDNDIMTEVVMSTPQAKLAITKLLNGIKDEIKSQAPMYSKMMNDYSSASDLINEIEKALIGGQKATVDASLRKLQSVMRNNVNTSYGHRLQLVKLLEEQGGSEIIPSLAGMALSEGTPRGIQGGVLPVGAGVFGTSAGDVATGLAAAGGFMLASSPRLVGETAHAIGRGTGVLSRGTEGLLGIMPMTTQQALELAYQSQQPKEER